MVATQKVIYLILLDYICAELLKKINHFSEIDAIFHIKEILNGFKVFSIKSSLIIFQALHERNIMHRDFKAANVFIKDDIFKIGDFGFAK